MLIFQLHYTLFKAILFAYAFIPVLVLFPSLKKYAVLDKNVDNKKRNICTYIPQIEKIVNFIP